MLSYLIFNILYNIYDKHWGNLIRFIPEFLVVFALLETMVTYRPLFPHLHPFRVQVLRVRHVCGGCIEFAANVFGVVLVLCLFCV